MINLKNFNIGDVFFDANGEKGTVVSICMQKEFIVVRPFCKTYLKVIFSNNANHCFDDMFNLFQVI